MMLYKTLNKKPLYVCDSKFLKKCKNLTFIPYKVLLTAWSSDIILKEDLNHLIQELIRSGTRVFMCVGKNAERLHDEIDEIVYLYQEKYPIKKSENIITTYHKDETLEDIIEFCIYGIEMKKGSILFILDLNIPEDNLIHDILVNKFITNVN